MLRWLRRSAEQELAMKKFLPCCAGIDIGKREMTTANTNK
jgi:hypothetical protein